MPLENLLLVLKMFFVVDQWLPLEYFAFVLQKKAAAEESNYFVQNLEVVAVVHLLGQMEPVVVVDTSSLEFLVDTTGETVKNI